ncbi:MAG: sialate O-acetylesterase [Phycisphaerae bacterium]|nr:sialate O-acetylesterase [Phycisphaerae bacterium]
MTRRLSLMTLFAAVLLSAAGADVKLPNIFGDNMVLQRDAKVAVWGKADAGEQVTVTVGDAKATATADKDGKWRMELPPMKAGGPIEVVVAGKNTITLKNVLVGDVWIGSGQSNMTMAVSGCNDAAKDIASADLPKIHLFSTPMVAAATPQDDVAGRWVVCDPKTVPNFSAALFFFGRDLHKKLDVPMGLIHSSWGGTPIEAWTSRAGYEAEPKIKPILERWDAAMANYTKAATAFVPATGPDGKPVKAPAKPVSQNQPTCLFNAKIAPLIPFTIKGVIWYQGESNAGNAGLYRVQMPAMIADWRKLWGSEFPFFQVQLANFMARKPDPADSNWAKLREAQLKTWQADAKTGMAVIIDVGDAKDIHPKDKQTVGGRLALAARAVAYGEKELVYSGPIYKAMAALKVEGNKVRLAFDHVGGGLEARQRSDEPAVEGNVPLRGFAVAGEDKKFVWADAKIEGNEVVVSSDKVEKPVAVRYGWADNPNCNLYNKEGLPASPFRTDEW